MIQRRPARPRHRGPGAGAALVLVSVIAASALGGTLAAQSTADAVLYRIFLRDGGMLVSYGEFAHVADRIVVSIPIGGTASMPVLHLLTLAENDVDWARTEAYVQAVRARRYAETRGETDFARLTHEVADALNRVGLVSNDAERLALAERARRQLVEWPSQHFGYRSEEIAQMATWLDQVVSELRVAMGHSSFDLTLIARPSAGSPPVTLLPPPDLRERVEFALIGASRTTDAAERVSLLRAVLDTLHPLMPEGSWMAAVHARASAALAVELRTDRAYAELTKRTLSRAAPYARRGDVRGLEALVRSVLDEDGVLKRARPAEVAALLAALDSRIDSARRLRLARDAWALRAAAVGAYWRAVRPPLDRLLGVREWLTDVRQLAGPAPRSVRRLSEQVALAARELARLEPPAEAASVHGSLAAASVLAARAAAARLDAVRTGDLDTAWQASSAAAGSLMLLEQGLAELSRITREPAPASR